MKHWEIIGNFKFQMSNFKSDDLIDVLLRNRGLTDKKEIDQFLHPQLESVTPFSVGVDKTMLKKTVTRIKKAIEKKEQIIVFGDYDVDGITGTAILWETLYFSGANARPYIPHRIDEGYGLSVRGLENVLAQLPETKLIITVDNGIVAHEAVSFAKAKGIDVIITDHHAPPEEDALPDAYAIVHTTKLCGAGVAYVLSKEFKDPNDKNDTHLELAALGTVADLVPLTGANRTIVMFGLKKLCTTVRPGIVALFKEAACDQATAGVYQISHVIAPRLNASGRMTSAMDSLRLLCTKDVRRASELANKLGTTNRERQMVMMEATEHASLSVKAKSVVKKMLVVSDEKYPEGVIGLVAGRLVEEYYRPSIVISKGEKYSKGSVRSIKGFNMIEFLRSLSEYFVNVGGHPMAAGFTVETERIAELQAKIEELSESLLDDGMLTRSLRVDCGIPLGVITKEFYEILQQLAPFGMGNPEPAFVTRGVQLRDPRYIGKENKHLKFQASSGSAHFEAVAFGMGDRMQEVTEKDTADIVYTIDENLWNGNRKLQLKIKDLR